MSADRRFRRGERLVLVKTTTTQDTLRERLACGGMPIRECVQAPCKKRES